MNRSGSLDWIDGVPLLLWVGGEEGGWVGGGEVLGGWWGRGWCWVWQRMEDGGGIERASRGKREGVGVGSDRF